VWNNKRSHTGDCILTGWGAILSKLSPIEAEVVVMSYEYYVPYAIWIKKSTKQQGYEFKVNEVFQGNQSAIKIKKNGRKSCMGSFN